MGDSSNSLQRLQDAPRKSPFVLGLSGSEEQTETGAEEQSASFKPFEESRPTAAGLVFIPESELNALRSELDSLNRSINAARQEKQVSDDRKGYQIVQLQKRVLELLTAVSDKQQELDSAQEQKQQVIESAQKQIADVRSVEQLLAHDHQVAELRHQIRALRKQLGKQIDKSSKENARLKGLNSMLQEALSEADAQKLQKEAEKEALKAERDLLGQHMMRALQHMRYAERITFLGAMNQELQGMLDQDTEQMEEDAKC
ncbi:hypothetical protein M8818_002776 [Zalaria obscura]|uniref:Uncharacterized protein n=1 Tax=Zalaria obscura TaxID=2024903 RepID=A0ACC3SHI3_9PEZI